MIKILNAHRYKNFHHKHLTVLGRSEHPGCCLFGGYFMQKLFTFRKNFKGRRGQNVAGKGKLFFFFHSNTIKAGRKWG